ncbi:hypothetical protein SDC9_180722 [bioreactor metagenome]|uniref:Uncharacterized protein n=1 Tax=bioreactor metagenome TaxID=1076179 RepID=A0A645H2J7_9ZZZZ
MTVRNLVIFLKVIFNDIIKRKQNSHGNSKEQVGSQNHSYRYCERNKLVESEFENIANNSWLGQRITGHNQDYGKRCKRN